MKNMLKLLILVTMPLFMLTADLPFLIGDLVPDANAILGVRRRAVRRGVVIGAAASSANAAATAQQQSATAQQQSATAQQQSATAQQQAAATTTPSPAGATLPVGTIVNFLPAGCPPKTIGGVEYHYCGGNYYRTAFQGSNLVYVTAIPQ